MNSGPKIGTLIVIGIIAVVASLILKENSSLEPVTGMVIQGDMEIPALIKTFKITAYCPCEECCGEFADGITASGHEIKIGDRFCAAPSRFLYGTVIDIPKYGKVPVLDRGGAIKGDRFDVYFDTHQEALDFGEQFVDYEEVVK